jgi:hypothetical protein
MDIEPTLAFVVGATVAVMRGILEGRLEPDSDVASAEAFLTTLGLGPREAAEIARCPYPAELLPRSASVASGRDVTHSAEERGGGGPVEQD